MPLKKYEKLLFFGAEFEKDWETVLQGGSLGKIRDSFLKMPLFPHLLVTAGAG
ncbi:MAG: hypothetical protein WCI18_11325 [Pseudomonadota bacterium]